MRVLVIGGTGFIGREIVGQLARGGNAVRVPTRQVKGQSAPFKGLSVEVVRADVHRDDDLNREIAGCDAVVSLVGVLHSRNGQPYGPDFDRVHVQLPRRIAQVCAKHSVQHLVHISALGANASGPSGYLRSKAAGEAAIQLALADMASCKVTVFRPSVVFGSQDKFMNMFAQLSRFLPVLPIAGASSRLQPVFVGDVADAVCAVIGSPDSTAKQSVFDLAGPKVYTLQELVRLAALWSGRKRWVLPLPDWVGHLQALFFELLPGEPIMSRDNLASLSVDNVSHAPLSPELGLHPKALEDIAPGYLAPKGQGG